MRRHIPLASLLLALAALVLVFPLAGCSGSHLAPGARAAFGWRDTPELTGPALDVGLGEYELGSSSFGSPDGEATPAPAPQPDPALVQALKDLDARQAAAAEQLKTLDARVASGALSPDQAKAIQDATASGDASATAAREAAAEVSALKTKLAALEGQGLPPWFPTDWTLPGIGAFALGWIQHLRNKGAAAKLRDQLARVQANAMAHATRAIKAFDDLPETASAAEVQLATAPPPMLGSDGKIVPPANG